MTKSEFKQVCEWIYDSECEFDYGNKDWKFCEGVNLTSEFSMYRKRTKITEWILCKINKRTGEIIKLNCVLDTECCKPKNNNSIHLLSSEIVRRIKNSPDSYENCCQVVENLIRESIKH